MLSFGCISCGKEIEAGEEQSLAVCPACGVRQPAPVGLNLRAREVYARATEALRDGDSFAALQLAERLLVLFPESACVYWLAILAEYGVEYIRTRKDDTPMLDSGFLSVTAVFSNLHYAAALACADDALTAFFEENAALIDARQRHMLNAALHAQDYDVFLSCDNGYGAADDADYRTASGLYRRLRKSGLRVYLRGESGAMDEPSVFAALHSAKVMLVIGAHEAAFTGQNVKGDWYRFLELRRKGDRKLLLPLYAGFPADALPAELAALSPRKLSEPGCLAGVVEEVLLFCSRFEQDKTLRTRVDVMAADEIVRQFDLAAQKRGSEEQRQALYDGLCVEQRAAASEEAYRRAAAGFRRLSGFYDADARADACLRSAERLRYEPMRSAEAARLENARRLRAARERLDEKRGGERIPRRPALLSSFFLFCAAVTATVLLLLYAIFPLAESFSAG